MTVPGQQWGFFVSVVLFLFHGLNAYVLRIYMLKICFNQELHACFLFYCSNTT